MARFQLGKRAKELETVATRQGFTYLQHDQGPRRPFTLFTQAEDRVHPENVIRGTLRGHGFCAFDLMYVEDLEKKRRHAGGEPWLPYESPGQFTCVVIELSADVPTTILNPRERRRLFDAAHELEPDSAALGALFQIWSELPNMARWLGDERFLDFLSNTRGKFAFELRGDGLLVIASDVRSQDVIGLIAMGAACADSIPAGLLKAFHRPDPAAAPTRAPETTRDVAGDDAGDGDGVDAGDGDVVDGAPAPDAARPQPAGQVTDLREVRSSRDRLKAGRRSAMPATSREGSLPPPPTPEAWQAWLDAHAAEVAAWDAPAEEGADEVDEPRDWASMSAEERAEELASLKAMVDEGLITQEEFREALDYLSNP